MTSLDTLASFIEQRIADAEADLEGDTPGWIGQAATNRALGRVSALREVEQQLASTPALPRAIQKGIERATVRFWAKVDKSGECWLWRSTVDKLGYGMFTAFSTRERAHRFAYESENGPVPTGLELDHLCRVHGCVRPSHLEAVPHIVNVRRGDLSGNGENHRQKRACPAGHPYDENNTYYAPGDPTHRSCRACARERHSAVVAAGGRHVEHQVQVCDWCGSSFQQTRSDQRYCQTRCRKRAGRAAVIAEKVQDNLAEEKWQNLRDSGYDDTELRRAGGDR